MTREIEDAVNATADRMLRGVSTFRKVYLLIAVTAWVIFLLVFPPILLSYWMAGWALVLSVLGLFVDRFGLDALLAWTEPRKRRLTRIWFTVYHLAIGVGALVLIVWPSRGEWELLPDTDGASDPVVTWSNVDGLFVLASGRLRSWDGDAWTNLDYPGGFAWVMGVHGESVWVAPRDEPFVHYRNSVDGQWSVAERGQGRVQRGTTGCRFVTVVARGGVATDEPLHPRREWDPTTPRNGMFDVAFERRTRTLLAVGRRWMLAENCRDYVDVTPDGVTGHTWNVAAGGGYFWIFDGQFVGEGKLWVADSPRFTAHQRTLPVNDVRTIEVNPQDGHHAIAASWGQGVWQSEDGGETWEMLGLRGVEGRSLAVDWEDRRIWVGASNLMFSKGVWTRTF